MRESVTADTLTDLLSQRRALVADLRTCGSDRLTRTTIEAQIKMIDGEIAEARACRESLTADTITNDTADVTIGNGFMGDPEQWCFWETEYQDDMVIGPFDSEESCRAGVEDFYKHNNPFTSGQTEYVITNVRRLSRARCAEILNARGAK